MSLEYPKAPNLIYPVPELIRYQVLARLSNITESERKYGVHIRVIIGLIPNDNPRQVVDYLKKLGYVTKVSHGYIAITEEGEKNASVHTHK